jgi:hypothetical protein
MGTQSASRCWPAWGLDRPSNPSSYHVCSGIGSFQSIHQPQQCGPLMARCLNRAWNSTCSLRRMKDRWLITGSIKRASVQSWSLELEEPGLQHCPGCLGGPWPCSSLAFPNHSISKHRLAQASYNLECPGWPKTWSSFKTSSSLLHICQLLVMCPQQSSTWAKALRPKSTNRKEWKCAEHQGQVRV